MPGDFIFLRDSNLNTLFNTKALEWRIIICLLQVTTCSVRMMSSRHMLTSSPTNMDKHILRANPRPEDAEWHFDNIPLRFLGRPSVPAPGGRERRFAKLIIFTPESITLQISQLSSNRVVLHEDSSKLIIASFEKFRFPDQRPSVASDYIIRMFKTGLFLNGRQYRFFGHGNSQLVSVTSGSLCAKMTLEGIARKRMLST